jgi:hypothetical protein
MNRLTPTLTAALFVTAIWSPRTTHVPFVGVDLLHAQQSAKSQSSSDDSDQDNDSDDDNDDDDVSHMARSARGPSGPRTVDIGRMLRPGQNNGTPLNVNLTYGSGTMSVSPITGPWLYDVHVTYTPGHASPRVAYNPASNTLDVHGSSGRDGDFSIDFDDHHPQSNDDLHVGLGRGVPLDVRLKFGAGDVTAQLGGLSIQRLTLETGASDAQVSFDTPNPIPLSELDLKVGAAAFNATGLGNAHVQHLLVDAAAGAVDLDFGGHWTGDATLDLHATLGAVHIHVPSGVVVDAPIGKSVIGSISNAAGGTTPPQSPGGPVYHLRVQSHAALGMIDIDRQIRE